MTKQVKKSSSPKTKSSKPTVAETDKTRQLADYTVDADGMVLTTNQGVPIVDDQNTLKAGVRGPSLLEDQLMREKITHFDHERIPERVVHARGSGAHGEFVAYDTAAEFTHANFLQPGVTTPVFVRFSTVAGSRGSSDMARDVRGFAVKFYTQEGVFDLVGNNIPVFFIQDAVKFPDLIHSVKPEPHHEMPQAASAHDTFWDFISLSTEAAHMIMWVMSDRAIPRSLRMMEGFGVHTFRLIDENGVGRFVKFHWKPLLGVHSVLWDEALKISGKDPDFHRRDLWEAIESGAYPEWELGLQIVEEKDEHKFAFDLLDPTKLIPEELVPVIPVGKMTLSRNPDNFFAETEQIAFCVTHLVPGVDVSNDPLMQGRLFSYLDTQISRLGGPNFAQIPINKSLAPVVNNQRDGLHQQTIPVGRTSYEPNTTGGGCPFQAAMSGKGGGFVSFPQPVDGVKTRSARSEKFFDHFSQATMFFNSQTDVEQQHIIDALSFELGKVEVPAIQERMIAVLERIDKGLAKSVATNIGLTVPASFEEPLNQLVPGDVDPATYQPKAIKGAPTESAKTSILKNPVEGIATRKIAILAADGVDADALKEMSNALIAEGAVPKVVAPHGGTIKGSSKADIKVDFALPTVGSVLFDALYIPGGADSIAALNKQALAALFVIEQYKHCKIICGTTEGATFVADALKRSGIPVDDKVLSADNGLALNEKSVAAAGKQFIKLAGKHRHWARLHKDLIPV